ncbi:MAG: hypothetical protein AB1595_06280 [bacterium]
MMKKLFILLLLTGGVWADIFVEPEYTTNAGTFTVTGSGFEACEEVLIEGCNMQNKITTTNEGTFSCVFDVSLIPGGEHIVTATGKTRVDNSRIWIIPSVKLSPNSGSFGDEIEVSGMGYGLGERVQVGLGRQHLVAEAYASTDTGTFLTKFIVSNHPKGENKLFAIGHSTYLLAEAGFVMKPKVLLNPKEGCVGSGVSLSGSGFTPQEEIRIDFGRIETLSTHTVDRNGNFQASFSCLKLPGKEQILSIQGKDFLETLPFNIKPRITSLEPRRGYVRTKINIQLDGLIPGEVLSVGFDDKEEYATYTINCDGTFTEGLMVDTRPGGIKAITIKTDSGIFHTQTFEIKPSISFITPLEPITGEKITFEGVGFSPFEKIRVDFGIREAILWTESNENGIFTAEYTIQDPAGTYRLVAIGYKTSNAGIINVNVVEPKGEEEKRE